MSFKLALVLPRRTTYRVCWGTPARSAPICRVVIVYRVDYPGIESGSLPTLSSFSVSTGPVRCLHPWSSCRSLRISPLHRQFDEPLPDSSRAVWHGLARLSRALSHTTYPTACGRFTPSNSGQRLPPLSYRGCWHRVSRGLFRGYRHYRPPKRCLQPEGLHPPRGVARSGLRPLTKIPCCCLP